MIFKANNAKGFSLVELMVVIAIIGILAAIAVPQLNKFQAKARQSEAKTLLASLYGAEKAFYAEYSAYHSKFEAVGFSPEGVLRYNVGFASTTGDPGVTNGYNGTAGATMSTVAYCGTTGTIAASGATCTVVLGSDGAAVPALNAEAVHTVTTFVGGAIARVYQANDDRWTINNNKQIMNTLNGIP